MEQYQFQYTNRSKSGIVLLICFASVFLAVWICSRLRVNQFVVQGVIALTVIVIFHLVKKIAVFDCMATINENSVAFDFGDTVKAFYFNDLVSFKAYYGKNAPVLYLNTATEKFKYMRTITFVKVMTWKNFAML